MRKTNLQFSLNSIIKFPVTFIIAAIFTLSVFTCYSQCPLPDDLGPINGTSVTCPGNSKVFSFAAAAGATSYTWTLPPGCSISGQNPYTGTGISKTIVFGAGFTPPGTISVTANNACGSSAPSTKLISANYPSMSVISGTASACPNDILNYSVASNPSTIYTWTVSPDITINSGQGTGIVNVTFAPAFVSGSISVSGDNGCGSGPVRTKSVAAQAPSKPSLISGSIVACENSTVNYSVNPVPNTIYDWTAPSGAVIAGQGTENVSITFPGGFINGVVSVKARTNCGSSSARNLNVRGVPAKPQPITGPASVLCNSTQVYTIAPVYAATSYIWTGTAGSTITSGQGTTSATISFPGTVTGNIKVKAANICGTSTARLFAVTGNTVIAQQPQNLTACEDDTTMLSVTVPGSGLTYQWRKDGLDLTDNADFSGTQTETLTILKVDSLNAGNYDVVVSSACAAPVTSSAAAFTVNMKPPEPGTIVHPPIACQGTSGVLSIPLSAYNTTGYFWQTLNSGTVITGGQGTNSISVDFGNTGSSGYTIYCQGMNGCGLSKNASSCWIRRSVSTPQITGSKYVCQGASGVSYNSPGVNGADSYTWSTSSPEMTIASGHGTLNITVDFSPSFTQGNVYLSATNLCMTTPLRIFKVYVDTSCRVTGENPSFSMVTERKLQISSGFFNELQIYPNPTAANLNVEFTAPEKNELVVSVSDVLGKNVLTESLLAIEGKNLFKLDLENINSGLYILKIKSANKIYQQKILVTK